jgi:hypothetical protein
MLPNVEKTGRGYWRDGPESREYLLIVLEIRIDFQLHLCALENGSLGSKQRD